LNAIDAPPVPGSRGGSVLTNMVDPQILMLSILLSIDPGIIRHREGCTTADHAVRQRF